MEEKQLSEAERVNLLGEELDRLQSKKNEGRGVNHLTYVVSDLKSGDLEAARLDIRNQSDKFGNIPDIKDWVTNNLFDKTQSPWEMDKDFRKRMARK